jgi:hypothetical protein
MNPQMNPYVLSAADFPDVPPKVFAGVERYASRLLTEGQSRSMLVDIKRVVLRCAPTTPAVAANLLTTLSKFAADNAPAAGSALSEVFTGAKVTAWIAGRKELKGSSRSLTEEAVRLRRLLRVQHGLPSVMNPERPRKMAAPPLKRDEFEQLQAACRQAGLPALRGFVATFGAGVPAHAAVGARFIADQGELVLRLASGDVRRILGCCQDPDLVDAEVHHGDWQEVCWLASASRLYLQAVNALQTFRELALCEPAPVRVLIDRYGLHLDALVSVIAYLDPVDVRASRTAAEALRGAPIESWVTAN